MSCLVPENLMAFGQKLAPDEARFLSLEGFIRPPESRAGATMRSPERSPSKPGHIPPLLKYAPVGTYITIEKIAPGGSLQARLLSTDALQFYWRYSHGERTFREPIGAYDPASPPKKLEPSARGHSVAAARERCRELARTGARARVARRRRRSARRQGPRPRSQASGRGGTQAGGSEGRHGSRGACQARARRAAGCWRRARFKPNSAPAPTSG